MYIIKVLKRRDAASVIAAIWLAMSLSQSLYAPVYQLSYKISQIGADGDNNMYGSGMGWRNEYLNPVVALILQVLLLEILIRLFVWIHPLFVRKSK